MLYFACLLFNGGVSVVIKRICQLTFMYLVITDHANG